MVESEAKGLLASEIAALRALSYEQLRGRIPRTQKVFWFVERAVADSPPDQMTRRVRGTSGTVYEVVTEVFWDHARGEDIRVVACIDGGDIAAETPICESYVVAPDGSFVDE